MAIDRRIDCVVIGKKSDAYFLTVAEAGGPITTFEMNEAVYRAMILRMAEVELDDARMRVRGTMICRQELLA